MVEARPRPASARSGRHAATWLNEGATVARTALLSLLATGLVGTSLALSPTGPVAAADADTTVPQVRIASPVASPETSVLTGDALTADFSCTDVAVTGADTSGIASC